MLETGVLLNIFVEIPNLFSLFSIINFFKNQIDLTLLNSCAFILIIFWEIRPTLLMNILILNSWAYCFFFFFQ